MNTLTADFSPAALQDGAAANWHEQRLKSTFAAMRRRWWLIGLLGCAGLAGAATWLSVAKSQYTATALVQLDTRNKFVSFESSAVGGSREAESNVIRTEVEVLHSDTVAERVVKLLNLTNDPEFSPDSPTLLAKFLESFPASPFSRGSVHSNAPRAPAGSPSESGTQQPDRSDSTTTSDQRSGFGPLAQSKTRATVVTDNNGVVLGSIVDNAAVPVDRSKAIGPNSPTSSGADQVGAGIRAPGNMDSTELRSGGSSEGATKLADSVQERLGEDKLALTIQRVKKSLSVEADGRSYIIRIGFAALSSEKAALIANAFTKQYLSTQIDAKMALTESANDWAKKQLDSAGVQLREAEEAIEQFRAQHEEKIEVAPGNSVGVSRQLGQFVAQLNERLAAATQARIAAETRLAATQALVKRNEVFVIPEVLASPLLQRLREEETRVAARRASLEARLGPQFPEVQSATTELARVQASIKSKVSEVISNIEAEVAVARAQEQELSSKVEAMRKSVGETSQQQLQLSVLERRAEARRTFYAAIEKRFVETSALLHGVYPDARIVARATPPPLPSWPNIPIMLFAGLLLGGSLGAAIAALLEFADKSFRTPLQLEGATGRTCLGILPDLGRSFNRGITGALRSRSSRLFLESVRTICIALDAVTDVNSPKKGHVILVTSALPQEGKTLSSVALAAALAASGSKTLLVDADLRRPQITNYLPGASRSHDLASLADYDGYPSAIEVDENFFAIRGGDADENAQRVFLSEKFGTFMETAKAEFDAIVIDSPPSMVVADAAILARFADVVVHVVRWGRTPRSTVLDSVDQMRRANKRSTSVAILNRVNLVSYHKYHRDGRWGFRYANYYRRNVATPAVEDKGQ
jgi:polysaccharide biosynthesis transport protein